MKFFQLNLFSLCKVFALRLQTCGLRERHRYKNDAVETAGEF